MRSPPTATGRPLDPATRLREFIDLAVLADQAGLDVFGVGEHHRPDFAIASPPVVLAAIAQATEQIRLTSAVTVLSTADPVKVFEDFTAVDLIAGGRAEITAGRGAYAESFPLFGHDTADYDELFEEKLDLLLRLNRHERDLAGPAPTSPARRRRLPPTGPGRAAGVDRRRRDPGQRGAGRTERSPSTWRSSANPSGSPPSPTSTAGPAPAPGTPRPTCGSG